MSCDSSLDADRYEGKYAKKLLDVTICIMNSEYSVSVPAGYCVYARVQE